LAATLLLTAAAGCLNRLAIASLPPHLVDQCGRQGDSRDAASLVVVGVLVRDALVDRRVPMHSDPKVHLRLRRVAVRVENVLKGAPLSGEITAYYFTWDDGFDGPRPLGFWRFGDRRVWWLRWDSGVLRTVCDGWDHCTMPVRSGAHPGYRADPGKAIDYALADLVLTRGEGAESEAGFAAEIAWGPPERGLQGYAGYVVEKLRRLALTEHGNVKSSACTLLSVYTMDRVEDGVREDAVNAIRDAGCQCVREPSGNVKCR
jgi:hypothetical protein